MSVHLQVTQTVTAPPTVVWRVLVDWVGQRRWIPFTTVRVLSLQETGLGVRCEALSGLRIGPVPVGLLDRFTVTAWQPPTSDAAGLLEVLHTGPYFRGPGAFELRRSPAGGTELRCSEIFDVVGGVLPTRLAALALPAMRLGFASSLRTLGRISGAAR